MRRLHLAVAALAIVAVAAPAAAQNARATGTVRDAGGKPIRGAIVRAVNDQAHPGKITSATDDKGRWAMIGLAIGQWQFSVEAEGYVSQSTTAPVRVAAPPSLGFVLIRDIGPMPGALDKNIAQQVTDANTLRDQGRIDQALSAYQEIRNKNPRLSSINVVLGDTYRKKASTERDPAARNALLEKAISSYTDALKDDAGNEVAKAELASTRTELSGGAR
jgi:hypothetical protein